MKEDIARAIRDLIQAEIECFADRSRRNEEDAEKAYEALLSAGEGAAPEEVSGGQT